MHVHQGGFLPNRQNQVDVRFWPGEWYKTVIRQFDRVLPQEPASREDIMTALEDVELLLIRCTNIL